MIEELKKLECGTIKENVDMKKYTTYKGIIKKIQRKTYRSK